MGVDTQKKYEEVIEELSEIRKAKIISYGEDRYSKEEGYDFDMMMVYSDIYRKYIRLKQLIKNNISRNTDGESLRDAFADLANYAIMGIQIYDSYKEEEK